jgi:pilus assembly protein CpaE
MPVDGSITVTSPQQNTAGSTTTSLDSRHDRPALIGFVTDAKTEEALRVGLSDFMHEEIDLRRGGIKATIAAMQKQATPKVLIVDVSGEEQPLTALAELSGVVEPDVSVLVVGDVENVDFYREVTRTLGVTEYLSKPITRERASRYFGVRVGGHMPSADAVTGGRAISVTGVRGGVGASTIAVNLGWHLGVKMRRHTVLLDPDMHLGTTAFLLGVQPGQGLRMALESPERIDALLAERAAQPVADRLHVLAGEEKINSPTVHADGAAEALIDSTRQRYNFIIADVPFAPVPLYRGILNLVDQRVLVMDPTLASVRDTVRLLGLQRGRRQDQRAIVVLNRLGMPGGLPRKQIEDALKLKVDVAIPDMPRQISAAATLGEPAIGTASGLRAAIIELARQVGAQRLLDAASEASAATESGGKRRWFWFRKTN